MAIIFATRTSDGSPLNMRWVRGTDVNDTVMLSDENTGVAVDLTGITSLLMRVRTSKGASATTLELSTANGRLAVGDPEAGEILVAVSTADTAASFPVQAGRRSKKYVYDLMIERSAGAWEAGIAGKLQIDDSTSHPADDA